MTMTAMKLPLTNTILATAILFAPFAASAQVPGQTYQQGVQSYNSQDPQNYGSPAAQTYPASRPRTRLPRTSMFRPRASASSRINPVARQRR
jgi:hypothetical protein